MAEAAVHPRRRTFGPVALVGLAAAGLASVSASNPWLSGGVTTTDEMSTLTVSFDPAESPLAAALGLVLLASWGVVLVTRGVFRRVVTWLGALAAVGYAVTTTLAPWQLREAMEESILSATGVVDRDLDVTAWWWTALVAAALACATSAAAVLWVRHWPEMGTKYDAPTGARASAAPQDEPAPTENIDIWKALDEGRDPTA
ncbi:MAG TPA: Trp biosynthesis-associated membrane protein [Nocardioides sp.]|nr:Trp biosynthesis-associated membrane protein [Nocardioides sp.]